MKTTLQILELVFAVPLGIAAAPFLLLALFVKAFRRPAAARAAVVPLRADLGSERWTRHAG
jgi:hypothetical protein